MNAKKHDKNNNGNVLKFRPFKRNVDDLLNPDVLDDETRRLLLADAMAPPPPLLDAPYARPGRADAGTDTSGNVQRAPTSTPPQHLTPARRVSASRSPPPDATDSPTAAFPAHLRAKVKTGAVSGSGSSGQQDSLVSAMAARLAQAEKSLKVYQSELTEERNKYRTLNDKYQKEMKKREDAENIAVVLYDEKKELERELRDIKKFLSDYGLAWTGGKASGASTPATSPRSSKAAKEEGAFDLYAGDYGSESEQDGADDAGPVHFNNTAKKGTQLFSNEAQRRNSGSSPTSAAARGGSTSEKAPINVGLLKRNAMILSDYVGSGHIVSDGKTAGLRSRDVVRVVIYKNGICVNGGVFRPYGWPLCEAFLQDLAEGFYPYEFKDKYPDGYPIEVIDKSSEDCTAAAGGAKVGGVGHRLGGDTSTTVHNTDVKNAEYRNQSREEFLAKLPKQHVTPSGKIINLRDGVAGFMEGKPAGGGAGGGGGDSKSLANMGTIKHVTAAEKEYRAKEKDASAPPSLDNTLRHNTSGTTDAAPATAAQEGMVLGDLVAVLVRLPDGQKTKLQMKKTSTVRELRTELQAAAPELVKQRYELCQSYPSKTLDDHNATLESLGITRTCTLTIRVIK